MVKRFIIIYLFSLVFLNTMAQVENRFTSINNLRSFIVEASDTFKAMPINSESLIEAIQDGDKNKYYFKKYDSQTLVVRLPKMELEDTTYAGKLFEITDSLIKTDNYLNRIFAHSIYHFMISYLAGVENEFSENNKTFVYHTKLMQDVFYSDIKYCGRYTFLLFTGVEPRYFTDKVIKEMGKLLEHPFLTREDAEFMIKSKKRINFIDTAGYMSQFHKFQQHDSTVDDYFVRNTYHLLENLKKKGISLKEYNDDLQRRSDSLFMEEIVNKPIKISSIYEAIGRVRIKELASVMEKHYIDTSFIELVFARIQYKDYEDRVIAKLSKIIKDTKVMDFYTYFNVFRDLSYIHTQRSFAAIAPLLLREERIGVGDEGRYLLSIGSDCLLRLNKLIANLPWEYSVELGGKYISEIDFEKEPYPRKLLMEMYKWMNDNKGEYKLLNTY